MQGLQRLVLSKELSEEMSSIFSDEVQRILEELTEDEKNKLDEIAFWIAKNWYKHPVLRKTLAYKGISVGSMLEYDVIQEVLPILILNWRKGHGASSFD
jgi:hypothetical protein